ncbi:hypothetical protein HYS97_03665 [Candidatus Daviesbacteria bacterium]|nr:hypothetical protein [Candidatus Daviesbacteria bacterium]
MVIWLVLAGAVLIISFILAFRSMKGFKEIPQSKIPNSLFLIRNTLEFNEETVRSLGDYAKVLDSQIAFERLFRGQETALVIYGPKTLPGAFPKLNLLEIEDYLGKTSVDESIGWIISGKIAPAITNANIFAGLKLGESQKIYWQIVCFGPAKSDGLFQATIRVLILDKSPAEKAELAKKLKALIEEKTGLLQKSREESTSQVFEEFVKRSLSPRELSKFSLRSGEILSLLH